jgi:hypothetical protein
MIFMKTRVTVFGLKWIIEGAVLLASVLTIGAMPVTSALAESPNDILVIANLGVTAQSIAISELRDIFLKKRASWSPGEKAIPIHPADNPKLRAEFCQAVLNMSVKDEQSYWQVRKIKEGEVEPPAFGSIIKAVYKLRGSVSYVYRSQFKKGVVKVVLTVPAAKESYPSTLPAKKETVSKNGNVYALAFSIIDVKFN